MPTESPRHDTTTYGDDTVGGDAFYDRPGVAARYDRHRRDSPTSPNTLMEHPALLDELGPAHGLDVIDLGCGPPVARHRPGVLRTGSGFHPQTTPAA